MIKTSDMNKKEIVKKHFTGIMVFNHKEADRDLQNLVRIIDNVNADYKKHQASEPKQPRAKIKALT